MQGQPCSNITIPDCMISSNATLLFAARIFPLPASETQFIGNNKSPITAEDEIVRIDHQFTDKF